MGCIVQGYQLLIFTLGHLLVSMKQAIFAQSDFKIILQGLFAHHACLSLQYLKLSGMGPTGYLHVREPVPYVPAWSTMPSEYRPVGARLLNEDAVLRRSHVLGAHMLGVYLHVDDTISMSEADAQVDADQLMLILAEAFEEAGYYVPADERVTSDRVEKVVGYRPISCPAALTHPHKKLFPLEASLTELSRCRLVDVEVLRALVGIYNFGALLNRVLMSIPLSINRMCHLCEGQKVRMWPSVRREIPALGTIHAVCQV